MTEQRTSAFTVVKPKALRSAELSHTFPVSTYSLPLTFPLNTPTIAPSIPTQIHMQPIYMPTPRYPENLQGASYSNSPSSPAHLSLLNPSYGVIRYSFPSTSYVHSTSDSYSAERTTISTTTIIAPATANSSSNRQPEFASSISPPVASLPADPITIPPASALNTCSTSPVITIKNTQNFCTNELKTSTSDAKEEPTAPKSGYAALIDILKKHGWKNVTLSQNRGITIATLLYGTEGGIKHKTGAWRKLCYASYQDIDQRLCALKANPKKLEKVLQKFSFSSFDITDLEKFIDEIWQEPRLADEARNLIDLYKKGGLKPVTPPPTPLPVISRVTKVAVLDTKKQPLPPVTPAPGTKELPSISNFSLFGEKALVAFLKTKGAEGLQESLLPSYLKILSIILFPGSTRSAASQKLKSTSFETITQLLQDSEKNSNTINRLLDAGDIRPREDSTCLKVFITNLCSQEAAGKIVERLDYIIQQKKYPYPSEFFSKKRKKTQRKSGDFAEPAVAISP